MRSFTSTYTFGLFDKTFHIKKLIGDITEKMKVVPKEQLELNIINIEKTVNIPIKKKVLQDYANGNIIVYTVDPSLEFPATIPILLMKDKGTIKAIINITNYITYHKDPNTGENKMKINDMRLFTYMCTAWLYRHWGMNEDIVSKNADFVRVCAGMYAKLIYKVLDKKYSIGRDIFAFDYCGSASAFFFAKCIAGASSDSAFRIAQSLPAVQDKDGTSNFLHTSKIVDYEMDAFNDFCKFLNDSLPKLEMIDPIAFCSEFSKVYNGAVLCAIDFFPYFTMLLFSAFLGGGIGKDILVNSTIRVELNEFMKILSGLY